MSYQQSRLSRGWILPALAAASCVVLLAAASWAQAAPKIGAKTHLNGKPSAMLHLTRVGGAGDTLELAQVLPNGTIVAGPLTMPKGAIFIVTDVHCNKIGSAAGELSASFVIPSTAQQVLRCALDTTVDGPERDIAFTTGQVLSEIPNVSFNASNSGSVRVRLRGYYAKDK